MTPAQIALFAERKANFNTFYENLIPTLVDFIKHLEIIDAHNVLRQAFLFVSDLDLFFKNIMITDEEDKIWLLTRIGYFVGEYFAQKYQGCWIVCEIPESKYFGRYVIGEFSGLDENKILDPFEVAKTYVNTPIPRQFEELLADIDYLLLKISNS